MDLGCPWFFESVRKNVTLPRQSWNMKLSAINVSICHDLQKRHPVPKKDFTSAGMLSRPMRNAYHKMRFASSLSWTLWHPHECAFKQRVKIELISYQAKGRTGLVSMHLDGARRPEHFYFILPSAHTFWISLHDFNVVGKCNNMRQRYWVRIRYRTCLTQWRDLELYYWVTQ